MVLLGFVKYFWRDAVQCIKPDQKSVLMTRLSNINTSGLNLSPLAGKTLVQYAGSLVGRDFRAVVQVVPFVLYDLLPEECYNSWLALCSLVPLIWQPAIENLDKYIVSLLLFDHFL